MNKNHPAMPKLVQPVKQQSGINKLQQAGWRVVHNQAGEGVLDTIISLLVIVVGLYLAVFVLSLVLRIIVLVAVAAAVIYLLSKLFKGVGDP